jgi:hypothetical protein
MSSTLPFVDGVTELDAATFNQMEVKASKGAVNGYASLDGGGKIPSAQLPSGVFVPLSAVGAASGVASLDSGTKVPVAQIPNLATTYQVRTEKASANGYASLDGTGKVPTAQLPTVVSGGPTPATTLPGSPTDGQEAILVDSTSAPTYSWTLQWLAAASRWIFTGGAEASREVDASDGLNSTSYIDLTNVGPSFTCPRAGIFELLYGAVLYPSQGAGAYILYASPKFGAAATSDNDAVVAKMVMTAVDSKSRRRGLLVMAERARRQVDHQYRGNAAGQSRLSAVS